MKKNNNRQKGHNLERWFKRVWESWGFKAKTSREASRLLDNCKVDLWNIPINVQCKSVIGNINPTEILDSMDEELTKELPHIAHLPKMILWYKSGTTSISTKCCKNEMLVVLPFDDFIKISTPWIETTGRELTNR